MNPLTAVSSVDGRYQKATAELSDALSEYALIGYRLWVECEYLQALIETPELGIRPLTKDEQALLRKIVDDFSVEEAEEVKRIEAETNHDVKAVEYYLAKKLERTSLAQLRPWIHGALTPESYVGYAADIACTAAIVVDALEE